MMDYAVGVIITIAVQAPSTLLDRLSGLSRVSWSDPTTLLGWDHNLPAWAWALVLMGAVGFAAISYSRLIGRRGMRLALTFLRAFTLVFVVLLLAGPVLIRPDEKVEPDLLLMLVDRSASLQVRDTLDRVTGKPISRDAALRAAMRAQSELFEHGPLGQGRHIEWLGFGSQVFPIAPAKLAEQWPAPQAQTTAINTAIKQALQLAAGRPISAIVLFTDGRSHQATGIQLVHRLEQQAVSVLAVPLGAATLPMDLAILRADAPRQAFVNDMAPVDVTIEQVGGEEVALELDRVHVRLIDSKTNELLDKATLAEGGLNKPLRLTARSSAVGHQEWQVQVTYDNPDDDSGTALPAELITTNNNQTLSIELVDRPIRVLYVEGYPRWEYRYLKNLLLREQSLSCSILLLSADRDFAQEGDMPITRLPRDAQEMQQYDVIIIGDVSAGTFSVKQMALLGDHVAWHGAGLLFIGGQRDMPRSYVGSTLASLLPMRRAEAVSRYQNEVGSVAMLPTALARTLSLLELRSPEASQSNWPENLPPLRWVQDLGALKPSAEVLATAQAPVSGHASVPLLVRLRYGAGQSLYLATDETWRWRYGRGELYFEQFWIQLIRMLGRQRIGHSDEQARLILSSRRAQVDQPVTVRLRGPGTVMLSIVGLPKIVVTVSSSDDRRHGGLDYLELRPQRRDDWSLSAATNDQQVAQTFVATWRPAQAGAFILRVTEPILKELNISAAIEVVGADDELRYPRSDHERLALLAEQTGGQVVNLDELSRLADLVPNRARKTPNDLREPLNHSWLALIILLLLLTGEWVLRKMIRLV